MSPPPAPEIVTPAPPSWTYRFTPYGWLTALNGTQTIRGRSVKVDASFADIVEASDTLVALMGDFEARNGPVALFTDVVWSKIGADGNNIRSRTLAPGVTGSLAASLGLDIEMAIVEVGAAYEVYRSGPLAFDLLGGARYWHQSGDLSLALAAGVSTADLEVAGGRAFARSGSVDWVDPMLGARIRYTVAPGHELLLRGDIGGFGLGSDFSWQAIGAYGFELGTYQGITFSGVIGYRALYVDYAQGEGRQRYQFDMLQHGPVLGISARF
ncbi:Rz1 family lipoprotein [Microvirga calopogonii]|uniref:Rz1 family lipoprotein n=1 Tax=Microvirga calopogonii TaxID=2078013 RepID=UPI001FDFA7F0|nr:Rz1 family lipoprotein [Microvirga calopogonii]